MSDSSRQAVLDYRPPERRPRDATWYLARAMIIVPVAIAYGLYWIHLVLWRFGAAWSDSPPTVEIQRVEKVMYVMSYPLFPPLDRLAPGMAGWPVGVANALCWGWAAWLLLSLWPAGVRGMTFLARWLIREFT